MTIRDSATAFSLESARTYVARALVLTGLAAWEAVLALWVGLCSVLLLVGVGVPLLLDALAAVRSESLRQRRLARDFSGVSAHREDQPWPTTTRGGFAGRLGTLGRLLSDGRTWYDLLWHVVNPVVGGAIAFAPISLILFGLWGMALPLLWGPFVHTWDSSWYVVVPLDGLPSTLLAALLGVVAVLAGLALADPFVRLHGRWVRAVLTRVPAGQLQHRVEHLTGSRADVVEMQAAELRRIERDLHDGAQARLVAMGMNLAAAERLIDRDPEAARAVLQGLKTSSSQALSELRDLVRGIHPPVLADRGLTEAVRALALDSPLDVQVSSGLGRRLSLPVESAMYFATSEMVLNVIKHASATHVSVDIAEAGGVLRITVQDDGDGGADPSLGTGLRGIERRLAAFDGTLQVVSPAGGPTSVTAFVPVAASP